MSLHIQKAGRHLKNYWPAYALVIGLGGATGGMVYTEVNKFSLHKRRTELTAELNEVEKSMAAKKNYEKVMARAEVRSEFRADIKRAETRTLGGLVAASISSILASIGFCGALRKRWFDIREPVNS